MWSVEAVSQDGNASESKSSSRNPLDVSTHMYITHVHVCIYIHVY